MTDMPYVLEIQQPDGTWAHHQTSPYHDALIVAQQRMQRAGVVTRIRRIERGG